MAKITLSPLDARAAAVIAERRQMTVEDLISALIREEAAIQITAWRGEPRRALTAVDTQPQAEAAHARA